ncbi:MAG: hypothetical protein JW704_11240 [Anaerolineaceae bacterium]|nr:hypothetical protein [Anaerolineaceae bacterium]
MGWFGYGVMEGDDPLDVLGTIASEVGAKNGMSKEDLDAGRIDFHGYMFTAEQIEDFDSLSFLKEHWEDMEGNILGQVLGAVYLWTGAKMTDSQKLTFIDCARDDEWAKEHPARKACMDQLVEALERHEMGKKVNVDDFEEISPWLVYSEVHVDGGALFLEHKVVFAYTGEEAMDKLPRTRGEHYRLVPQKILGKLDWRDDDFIIHTLSD